MVVEYRLENIDIVAGRLLSALGDKKIIAFHGEMGAGKTTLIHALCKVIGVENSISSPTFSIINEYVSSKGNIIFHMDLFRLKNETEAMNAGVEDALLSGNLCLVEWPEKAPGIFPGDSIHCYLTSIDQNARKLQINL